MNPAAFPYEFASELSKMKTDLADGIDSVVNGMPKSLDPYVEARRDLEREFLERMPKRARDGFVETYMKAGGEERAFVDRFARNYIRYDRKWEMRVALPDEMKGYADLFHFKKTPTALSYYVLDTSYERKMLLEILEGFKR